MKNLIEPQIIAAFKQNPPSFEEVRSFLQNRSDVSASLFCKLIGANLKGYYDWKSRQKKKVSSAQSSDISDAFSVQPSNGKRQYTPIEKLSLVTEFLKLENGNKTEFLRKFGLYQSDIKSWNDLMKAAAVEALSKRKTRSDKKSEIEVENEILKKEVSGHEKTIAKLAALVVIQKKVSELLDDPNQK